MRIYKGILPKLSSGNRVYGKTVSRVRIPPTPPEKSSKPKGFGDFCLFRRKLIWFDFYLLKCISPENW